MSTCKVLFDLDQQVDTPLGDLIDHLVTSCGHRAGMIHMDESGVAKSALFLMCGERVAAYLEALDAVDSQFEAGNSVPATPAA